MLEYPKRADVYTRSIAHNDYGEEVSTGTLAFSTGSRLSTLSFKEILKSTGTVDTTKFFCYTRKNVATTGVVVGDYFKVDGDTFGVIGIDPMHGNRSEIMFLLDLLQDVVI